MPQSKRRKPKNTGPTRPRVQSQNGMPVDELSGLMLERLYQKAAARLEQAEARINELQNIVMGLLDMRQKKQATIDLPRLRTLLEDFSGFTVVVDEDTESATLKLVSRSVQSEDSA